MRRPGRSTPRLRWMSPASPGELKPMDRLMIWLERNREEYRASKRKIDLLEQLGEEMATNGIYGLTINSIRSQISRLKHGVQAKAEGGKCASKDVNAYYDRLLDVLFDDNERAEMRERAREHEGGRPLLSTRGNLENRQARTTRSKAPRELQTIKTESEVTDESEAEDQGTAARPLSAANFQRLAPVDPILDTMEIRRRYELLSARQGLQSQGVDPETIESFVPLNLT
ncbi:hypothetical protein PF010_g19506 [Phytophthora fragariae]|nr:hypothetical protein PF003_g31827 [Phytophthora fragariae]KAE8928963.1 hypothetical protein PF009_g20913 [Phytophthora fragariae]KAE9088053.1 hypothetical protein PF010_g19506 [Phytophthora fragariae]KAE9088214.1 hypothetical protein PF007_g20062 [Phytophthora fragariae]KAE9117090.1 hypothetical protein PF006_g18889 [Phytophthora fragariae]